MKKKMHPADIAARERIADAVEYTAYLRRGPFEKIVERTKTLANAAILANQIEEQNPGRKALVYAVMPNGDSIPVPADMREAALKSTTEDEAMNTKPLSATEIAKLTAVITGGAYKRAATKDAAVNRFLTVFVERVGVPLVAASQRDILDAGSFEAAKAMVEAVMRQADEDNAAAVAEEKAINSSKRKAAPKPAKSEKAAKPAKEKPLGKRAAILEAAQRGELPPVPDFSAPTHTRFRKKLAEVVAMVEAGDIKGLKAYHINPVSSSPKAIDRYRNLAVIALEAQTTKKKEAA